MASKFTTAEGKPTRHTLTSHDIADIQHHTVYLTFTPEEGEDISAFLHPSNVYDLMEDHLEMIEGILSFPGVLGQPEEFLVVCKPSETFSDLLRIAMGTCVFEKEKHGFKGRYQLHAQVLFDLKETRAEFVNMCEGHLFSCLTTGSTFEGDYLWEANSTYILTSTPHKDPLKRWQSTLTDLTPEKMAEVLDLVIKVATEKGIPPPKPGNGTPTPTPQPSEPQNGGGLPQPGIGGGGAPQPGGYGWGGSGGGVNPPNVDPPRNPIPYPPNPLEDTFAKASESIIKTLVKEGMLKSSKVTFRTFSGDTEDVDLAIWLKDVQLAQIKYTEEAIIEGIRKSLKGKALTVINSLPIQASSNQLIECLEKKFGVGYNYDTLMGQFYGLKQDSSESVTAFGTKLETTWTALQHRFPHLMLIQDRDLTLKSRFFSGSLEYIQNAVKHKHDSPAVTYDDLVQAAREAETIHSLRNGNNSTKKETNNKPQKTKITAHSSVVSSPNPDIAEDPQVAKCQSARLEAQKAATKCEQLMEQMVKPFNDWKSQVNNPNSYNHTNNGGSSRGRGRGGRSNGRGGRGGSGQNGSGRGQLGTENPSTPNPGNNQDHGQNNQNRPQQFQQRRGPFCFHCEEVDPQNKTTHWARQCELLKAIRQQAHKIAEQNRGTNLENL